MPQDPDYIVNIEGQNDASSQHEQGQKSTSSSRLYISVLFDCCGIYQRLYRNKQGTAYQGRCPKCLRPLEIKVGPGGTNARFFRAK